MIQPSLCVLIMEQGISSFLHCSKHYDQQFSSDGSLRLLFTAELVLLVASYAALFSTIEVAFNLMQNISDQRFEGHGSRLFLFHLLLNRIHRRLQTINFCFHPRIHHGSSPWIKNSSDASSITGIKMRENEVET